MLYEVITSIDRAAMVDNMQPIANLHAVAVDRQRFALHAVMDHQRNQLLGKLIWAIVIRAACDVQRHAECFVICAADKIRAGSYNFV